MMTGRTHRRKRILCPSFHHCIDRLARRAGAAHGGLQRMHRNHRVAVQITNAFANGLLDMFEVLWRVASLNVTTARFFCFDLNYVLPKFGVAAQRFHHDVITLGGFRMTRTRVVLFENRMMNYSGWHSASVAHAWRSS